jgi:hypothetical protein
MFRATVSHRSSQVYRDLLGYVSRFRRYSAYNCFLIRLQRPTVGYVATPSDWMRQFERRVKPDARPLVMLRPFGPVMFLYDIADTEGEQPPPADLLKPFDAKGALDPMIWSNTEKGSAQEFDKRPVLRRFRLFYGFFDSRRSSLGRAVAVSDPAEANREFVAVVSEPLRRKGQTPFSDTYLPVKSWT